MSAYTTYRIFPVAAERIPANLEVSKALILMLHFAERTLSHNRWMDRLGRESRQLLGLLGQALVKTEQINRIRDQQPERS